MNAIRERGMRAAPLIVLATAALTLLWDVVVGGKAMVPADVLVLFEPWRTLLGDRPVQNHYLADVMLVFQPLKAFVAAALHDGRFPLWLPNAGLGYPITAAQESYFTWAIPLYAFLDFWTARTVELFGIVFLAGAFAYAYLRRLGCSSASACLGGIVAMLGFQFVQNLLTGHYVASMLWLPLILLTLDESRRRDSMRLRLVAGGLTGVALLAASLQAMLYIVFLIGLDVLWHAIAELRAGRSRHAMSRFAAECGAIIVLGIVVASVRLFPSIELLRHSERTLGLSWSGWLHAAGSRLLAIPMVLIGTLAPDALGDHRSLDLTKVLGTLGMRATITGQEFKPYIGIVPLGCLLWSVTALRADPIVRRFLVLLLVPVLLAALTPFGLFLYFPRVLVMAVVPMAVLAALGADALLHRTDAVTVERIARRWGIAWLTILIAASLLTLAVRARQPQLTERARAVVGAHLDPREVDAAERERQLAKAERFVAAASFPSAMVNKPALWALVAMGSLLLLARGRRSAAVAVAIAASIADLALMDRGFLPVVDRASVTPSVPGLERLREDSSVGRVVAAPERVSGRPFLPPNTLLLYGLDDARMYESLFPTAGLSRSPELWDAIGVTHVVMPAHGSDTTTFYKGELRIDRRPHPLPRAYAAYGIMALTSDSAGAALIRSGSADLRREVLVDGATTIRAREGCAPAHVDVQERLAERVVLKATLDCDGTMVLADRWYPGWVARVGGKPMPILRANLGLRAVTAPRGVSTIEFAYRPASVRVGGLLSLVGALVAAVALGLSMRRT